MGGAFNVDFRSKGKVNIAKTSITTEETFRFEADCLKCQKTYYQVVPVIFDSSLKGTFKELTAKGQCSQCKKGIKFIAFL